MPIDLTQLPPPSIIEPLDFETLFAARKARFLDLAKPDCIVMHPGPINRGRELSSEVADFQRSVILNQVENGIAVRMAVLERIIG